MANVTAEMMKRLKGKAPADKKRAPAVGIELELGGGGHDSGPMPMGPGSNKDYVPGSNMEGAGPMPSEPDGDELGPDGTEPAMPPVSAAGSASLDHVSDDELLAELERRKSQKQMPGSEDEDTDKYFQEAADGQEPKMA